MNHNAIQTAWLDALRAHDRATVRGAFVELTDASILALVETWLRLVVRENMNATERNVQSFVLWAVKP